MTRYKGIALVVGLCMLGKAAEAQTTCPGNFVMGIADNAAWNFAWDFGGSSGKYVGERIQPLRGQRIQLPLQTKAADITVICNGATIEVQQTTASDGNNCVYFGAIIGASVTGTQTCSRTAPQNANFSGTFDKR